jgi:hypothetical protein
MKLSDVVWVSSIARLDGLEYRVAGCGITRVGYVPPVYILDREPRPRCVGSIPRAVGRHTERHVDPATHIYCDIHFFFYQLSNKI